MWSRNASLSSSLSSRALPPPPPPQQRRSSATPTAGGTGGPSLSQKRHDQDHQSMRSRTWASMGDLAQANAASSSSASCSSASASGGAAAAVAAAVAAGSGGGGAGAGSMGLKRRSMTSTSFADVAEEGEDEAAAGAAAEFVGGGLGGRETVGERAARGGGSGGRGSGSSGSSSGGSGVFRPCLSRASLAASDEGGETDFADQTMSEASDFECDNDGNPTARSRGHSSHEAASNLFRERVRGTIRKRVGGPQVPPLPPPRHLRVVQAVKRIPSQNVITPKQPELRRGANGGGTAAPVAVAAAGPGGGAVGGGVPAGGLGVAGLFHEFRKGMVDMAAQEMGKTLARWPGGSMPSVGSLASLAAGGSAAGAGYSNNFNSNNSLSVSGNFNSNLQTPPGSPRSVAAGFSSALTDSPVRWGSSSSHGSTASSEAETSSAGRGRGRGGGGGGGGDVVRAVEGAAVSSPYHSVATATAGLAAAAGLAAGGGSSATNLLSIVAGGSGGGAGAGGGGLSGALTRVGSVSSRTALIQVSDLELAEPCGTRIIAGDSDFSARRPSGATDDIIVNGRGVPGESGGEERRGGHQQQRDGGVGLGGLAASTPKKRRVSAMGPRPAEEYYELLFSTQVIGLQFKELAGGGGVCVQGMSGYVGPTPTPGFSGERLSPGIGDVLESYNGVSAKGKSADVVARELARCGRPLRLGFRSVHSELYEGEEEEEGGAEEAEREGGGGGGGWVCEGSNGGEEGRSGGGRPLLSTQRVGGSPSVGGGQQQQRKEQKQQLRDGGGASSCRDDVAFSSPAHPWAVSS